MSTFTVPDVLATILGWACVACGAWNTYCAHASLARLRLANRDRQHQRTRVGDSATDRPTIVVVVPMLHEADQVGQVATHWSPLLAAHPPLRLCVVTTERERTEAPSRR